MTAGDDPLRETLQNRRIVYDGKLLRVFEDTVAQENGRLARREIVEHPGGVGVVALTDDDHVVLVRQWRHAISGALWEIPAGTRNPNEAPESTAQRELGEETGYRAARWRALGSSPLAPGYSSEVMHYFVARDLEAGAMGTDEDEQLEVAIMDRREVAALVDACRVDAKTIAGLALAGWLPRSEESRGG